MSILTFRRKIANHAGRISRLDSQTLIEILLLKFVQPKSHLPGEVNGRIKIGGMMLVESNLEVQVSNMSLETLKLLTETLALLILFFMFENVILNFHG